jgi:hypothetical protein
MVGREHGQLREVSAVHFAAGGKGFSVEAEGLDRRRTLGDFERLNGPQVEGRKRK